MKQIFAKNNTNSSSRTIFRQDAFCRPGTLRRPDAVPPTGSNFAGFANSRPTLRVLAFALLFAVCCVSCRNVIEAPENDEAVESTENGGGAGAAGKLYTLSGAVGGGGGAVPSSLAGNSRSAFSSDTGGGCRK